MIKTPTICSISVVYRKSKLNFELYVAYFCESCEMDGKFGKRKFIGWPRKGWSKLAYYLFFEIIMFLFVNSSVNLFSAV